MTILILYLHYALALYNCHYPGPRVHSLAHTQYVHHLHSLVAMKLV